MKIKSIKPEGGIIGAPVPIIGATNSTPNDLLSGERGPDIVLPSPPSNLNSLAPYPYDNPNRAQLQSPPFRPPPSQYTNPGNTLPLPPYGPPSPVPLSNQNPSSRLDRNELPTRNEAYRQSQPPPLSHQINRSSSPSQQPRDLVSSMPTLSSNSPGGGTQDNNSNVPQEGSSSISAPLPSFNRSSMQANRYPPENNQPIDPSIPTNAYRPRPVPVDNSPINSPQGQENPSQPNGEPSKRDDLTDLWPLTNNQPMQARSARI